MKLISMERHDREEWNFHDVSRARFKCAGFIYTFTCYLNS